MPGDFSRMKGMLDAAQAIAGCSSTATGDEAFDRRDFYFDQALASTKYLLYRPRAVFACRYSIIIASRLLSAAKRQSETLAAAGNTTLIINRSAGDDGDIIKRQNAAVPPTRRLRAALHNTIK